MALEEHPHQQRCVSVAALVCALKRSERACRVAARQDLPEVVGALSVASLVGTAEGRLGERALPRLQSYGPESRWRRWMSQLIGATPGCEGASAVT